MIIINETDKLSKEAQAALRRTMEKYIAKCRLILICENASRVILPIKSRCLMIRVGAPAEKDIEYVLDKVSKKEGANIRKEVKMRKNLFSNVLIFVYLNIFFL